MNTWLTDSNGNRASVEYFGTTEAAQAALDSLKNCNGCTNCRDCRDCSGCSDCRDCSGCRGCSDCREKEGVKGDFVPPVIPRIENIDAVILEACSAPDALDMRNWHSCKTTHCRADWVIHKAGEAGDALERFHGPALAAQLIYRESGSPISPNRFFESNDEAMTDMRKRAGVETAA